MDSEIITLAGALSYFKEDLETIKKGENKLKANFVLAVHIKDFSITAKVRASMKDKSYNVTINVDGAGGIESAECECPRGKWICSHMAAVAIYVNKKGMSKTDLPNSWIKHPKKASKENIRTISTLFPQNKPEYSALPRRVDSSDIDFLQTRLCSIGFRCPMMWVLGPEPPMPFDELVNLEISTLLADYLKNRDTFVEKCKLSNDQIQLIAEKTKLQNASPLWGKMRSLRLTGSNFGAVLAACNRNLQQGRAYPPSLFKTLRGEYDLSGKDAILWGQMHEKHAVDVYQKATGNTVEQVGLILFPCGFLGCSPDGMIRTTTGGQGVLEVKCPWKHRNKTVAQMIKEELRGCDSLNSFYLTSDGTLNHNHNYWHQIQAEIAAANVQWGHFVIWTMKQLFVLPVQKDLTWMATNLPKLERFYLDEFLPKICLQPENNCLISPSDDTNSPVA